MKKLFLFLLFIIVHCTLSIENCKSQWVQMSNGMGTTQTVNDLASIGSNIFAGTVNYPFGFVYISSNNGINWTQTNFNGGPIYSLAVKGNNIFAGTYDNYGHGFGSVYYSTNNGTNWTLTYLNCHGVLALATSGNNIFAGTLDSGVYLTTNNGLNWTQSGLNSNTISSLAISGNNIFAGSNGVFLSTNNGLNWVQTSLNNIGIRPLVTNGNNIFAGTSTGVFLSTNNGINWNQTTLNTQGILSLAISGNNIFAGTYDLNGVYLSTNNGIGWIQKNQGFTSIPLPIINVLHITNNFVFVGTTSYFNSVWRRSLSEIIEIKQISEVVPSSYSLQQNYPNPFNPSTKIRFDIAPVGQRHAFDVRLKIYDILGREITTLVNEKLNPGAYEVTFDARHGGSASFNSGVYFYRLTAGDFSETKKLVLLK